MFPRLGQSDLCCGEPLNVTGDAVVNLILLLSNDEGLQCTQRAVFAEIGTFLLELFFFNMICSSSLYRSVFSRHGYLFHFGAVLFFFPLTSSQRDRKQAGTAGPSLVQIPDRSVGMAGMLLGLGSWQGTHYWCTCKACTEGQFQTKQNTCANLLSSANS